MSADVRTNGVGDDERRNVVLVTVDSLRADHCGYWGYDRETTPTLDRMAEEGFVYDQAIAPGPSTYESMPAVFTGRHMTSFRAAVRRGAADDGKEDALDARIRNIGMNMNAPTLAEWFADRGYATGAFTTNPYTGSHTEFARGFDHYEDFMGEGEGPLMRKAAHVPILSELKHVITLVRGDRASKRWTEYYDDIVEWVEDVEEPYFLWVFLLDTHTPYLVDERYRSAFGDRSRASMYYHNWRLWLEKKWRDEQDPSALNRDALVDLYDASIRAVDDFLGHLREDLEGTDPAIVVHADHGEAFGEHGTFGHDAQLYEENLHVPLVVENAGFEGSESTPVSLAALPALLRAVAEGDGPPEIDDGPVLAKTSDAERFALRCSDWKYLCRADPSDGTVRDGLVFDLTDDPGEREPIDPEADLDATCRSRVGSRLRHERELNAVVAGVRKFAERGDRP